MPHWPFYVTRRRKWGGVYDPMSKELRMSESLQIQVCRPKQKDITQMKAVSNSMTMPCQLFWTLNLMFSKIFKDGMNSLSDVSCSGVHLHLYLNSKMHRSRDLEGHVVAVAMWWTLCGHAARAHVSEPKMVCNLWGTWQEASSRWRWHSVSIGGVA